MVATMVLAMAVMASAASAVSLSAKSDAVQTVMPALSMLLLVPYSAISIPLAAAEGRGMLSVLAVALTVSYGALFALMNSGRVLAPLAVLTASMVVSEAMALSPAGGMAVLQLSLLLLAAVLVWITAALFDGESGKETAPPGGEAVVPDIRDDASPSIIIDESFSSSPALEEADVQSSSAISAPVEEIAPETPAVTENPVQREEESLQDDSFPEAPEPEPQNAAVIVPDENENDDLPQKEAEAMTEDEADETTVSSMPESAPVLPFEEADEETDAAITAEQPAEPVILPQAEAVTEEKEAETEEAVETAASQPESAPVTSSEEAETEIYEEEPAAPPAEEEMTVLEKAEVPSVPVLFSSSKLVEEETYMPAAASYDEDFWASFYIAGEDDLVLEDGIYYMGLFVNGGYACDVPVQVTGGEISVSSKELGSYLYGVLTEEAYNRVFARNDAYLSIDYLDSVMVSASCNTEEYRIDLSFLGSDLPLQILSLRGNTLSRMYSRPISGGINLEPADFVLSSRYQLSFGISSFRSFSWRDLLQFYLTSNNSARLWDLYLDFNYYVDFGLSQNSFRMGNYKFHVDFPDEMIRVQWGTVAPDLLSPDGTAVGIRFDKSLSYGYRNARRRSQVERMISIDTESQVTVYNDDRQIYSNVLQPGQYRLEDFTLYTGTNRIRIVIKPLDGSEETEITMDINYSYSLLAPGEVYYGAAVATGRQILSDPSEFTAGAVRLPLGSSRYLEYDARNITASGYIRAGLTESLSLDATLALKNAPEGERIFNPSAAIALQLTQANALGTTRYNLNVTEEFFRFGEKLALPYLYARVGHQIITGIKAFNSVNAAVTYTGNDSYAGYDNRLSFSLGFSGTLGILGYSVNGNTGFDVPFESPSYSISGSFYFNPARSFTVSSTVTLSGYENQAPGLSWTVYGSYRFGKGSVNAVASSSRYSVTASADFGDHDVSFIAETRSLSNFNDYSFEAGYAYSGDYLRIGVEAGAYDGLRNGGLDFTLSTATLFADGLFTVSSYIPSNFILIKQEGALRNNSLSIGAVGSSSSSETSDLWGVSLYSGIPNSGGTSFSLYSQNPDSTFGNFASFDLNVPNSTRTGYVLKISAENKYTVSGVVETADGELWINGSSPLYSLSFEDGTAVLEGTEEYLFTDSDGRFIVSNLTPGLYAFDVPSESGWVLEFFRVIADEERAMDIQIVSEGIFDEAVELPEVYSGFSYLAPHSIMTGEDFWEMLYGSWEAAV